MPFLESNQQRQSTEGIISVFLIIAKIKFHSRLVLKNLTCDSTCNGWLAQQQYLNLGLDILNSVARLHFESDGLASECLDKDLHSTTQTQDQVQCWLFLDVVVTEGATIFQLFASKDQTLLVRWNALLILPASNTVSYAQLIRNNFVTVKQL